MPDETIAAGQHLALKRRADGWEYATRSNASGVVAIVAVTGQGELVLIEQLRPVVGRRIVEVPAGLSGDIDAAEALELAAARELEEETGFVAERLEHFTTTPSSAGLTDEVVDFFVAHGVVRTGEGGGDESEDITVHLVPLNQVEGFLAERQTAGSWVDAKVYLALHYARSRP